MPHRVTIEKVTLERRIIDTPDAEVAITALKDDKTDPFTEPVKPGIVARIALALEYIARYLKHISSR